ncbi:MAG TPA: Ku protein [Actinomycetota bacterium]|nr:Ku protein [Actinomycetota bacterium]
MRTIWKGAISFGLVTIPIRVFTAVEEKSLKFNQLHEPDQGRIKYKRVCSIDGEEVPSDQIVKGYEYEKDHYVVLTEDELDRGLSGSRAIEVLKFVRQEEIDPILFKSSYYLSPDGATGTKAYALLRTALGEEGLVALVKVQWRDKEHLATLRVKDDVFVLETMYWPDEIREPDFEELKDDQQVRDQEVQMARMLIESMTDVFKPDEFRDTYREKLEALVSQKIEGKEIAVVADEGEAAPVVDLMEALRASVEAVNKDKSATG